MSAEDLCKRWHAHAVTHPILAEMAFADGFLTLGAQTRLAKVGAAIDEPRLAALLTSAHGGPIEALRLRHVRRAVEIWRDGDRPLALTHLALSRLAKLRNPLEGARRLFLADALMSAGVSPGVIVERLASDSVPAAKYSPDQPRVPAGNGRPSGQWVGANSADSQTSAPPKGKLPNLLPIVDAAYQGKYHDIVRDYFAASLRAAGNTVLTEVPLAIPGNPPPPSARIDVLLRNAAGVLFAIEVKTGDDPPFTPGQNIVYPHIEPGGIVVSPDPRVAQVGLVPFEPWPPVEAVVLYAPGPGSRMEIVPMADLLKP
jgi:hypothetical protein